jgi:hypothetical protein
MQRNDDDRPCALVFRKKTEDAWALHCYTLSISVAWRTADMLWTAFKDEGVEEVQLAVMLRELYDEKRGSPLAPPSGFEHLILSNPEVSLGQRVKPSDKAKSTPDVEFDEDMGLGTIDKDMDF